jgi:hypothetical protein
MQLLTFSYPSDTDWLVSSADYSGRKMGFDAVRALTELDTVGLQQDEW